MDLTAFFTGEGITVYAEVLITDLPPEDREDIRTLLPGARSVIVFGMEVPLTVYRMRPEEKTRAMVRVAESLDGIAVRLADMLNAGHIPARPVPLYLPVRVREGRIHGMVRLKQAAAAGGLGIIGKSSLLLSPRFGPRVLLAGVVTARAVADTGLPVAPAPAPGIHDSRSCTGCDRCVRACPGRAIGPEGVDAFRCRSVRRWVPPVLVPAARWVLRRSLFLKCVAPLAPLIARLASIPCSRCVTECPQFAGSKNHTHAR